MKNKKMSRLILAFILFFFSCAVYAQEKREAVVVSQMAVYSQGLAQANGSLLIAEDFTYGSEGISFYSMPNGDLYVENGGNLFRFSPDKPGLPLVQGIWNGEIDHYVKDNLEEYKYPDLGHYDITLYCNEEKTQYLTLTNSHRPAPCKGCDYASPFKVTWHDVAKKETKLLPLAKDLELYDIGMPKYAFCKGNVFYYPSVIRNPNKKDTTYWCPVIRAHHILTGEDEVFFSSAPEHCRDILSGAMGIPGTDYVLYQMTGYPNHTYIWMKKALQGNAPQNPKTSGKKIK